MLAVVWRDKTLAAIARRGFMPNVVDFSRGGYKGDVVEETFKYFSAHRFPFWWHFREVLRASQQIAPYWKNVNDSNLSDDDQRQLIALSLLHYSVYTGFTEATTFFQQMTFELQRVLVFSWRVFEIRRYWKATYSSLYSSFNALCNILSVIIGNKSPFGKMPGKVWNYTPSSTIKLLTDSGINDIADILKKCKERLEIRDHLDHYWVIWTAVERGGFYMDKNFEKGTVPLTPPTKNDFTVDALKQTETHLLDFAKDFNAIYERLAISNGYLDRYLLSKGWKIDYTGYQPHGGKRPLP